MFKRWKDMTDGEKLQLAGGTIKVITCGAVILIASCILKSVNFSLRLESGKLFLFVPKE